MPSLMLGKNTADIHEEAGLGDLGPASCFLVCEVCAIWIPSREDSTASEDDMGICPRKEWPHNRTKATDGCRDGVWPVE